MGSQRHPTYPEGTPKMHSDTDSTADHFCDASDDYAPGHREDCPYCLA